MTEYLTLGNIATIAARILERDPEVRDWGLLESALLRPQTTVFGREAYPSFHEKAAALMQSLATNHALIDGNKRLAWVATRLFYVLNGGELTAPSADEGETFVVGVATGKLELTEITETLAQWSTYVTPGQYPIQRQR